MDLQDIGIPAMPIGLKIRWSLPTTTSTTPETLKAPTIGATGNHYFINSQWRVLAFSALVQLVRQQEGYPTCKSHSEKCPFGDAGSRCRKIGWKQI